MNELDPTLYITSNPLILSEKPVIRRTRLSVAFILKLLAAVQRIKKSSPNTLACR
jgi:uncharacterized protein (DUF433 family)